MASFDLAKLDTSNFGSWPVPVKLAAAALALLVVALVGWWMMVKPKQQEFDDLRAQEASLLAEFTEKQGKVVNLPEYKQQLADIEDLLKQMVRQLPTKTEMPDLLVDISQTALSAGIDNELFEPGSESPKQFYAERPIRLRMVGNYHQFGAFVSGVAALPRVVILTMHDVSLKPAETGAGKDQVRSGALVLEGTVKTYRALDESEQEVEASGPAGAAASPPASPAAQ